MGGNTSGRFKGERTVNDFGPITQLGYLTDDLDKTAKIWTSLGVGPFMRMSNVIMPATMDGQTVDIKICLLYTSPSPRDKRQSRMPSSA